MRIQWTPNLIREERRLCLTRIRWNRGMVGDGSGYSCKLSVSICFCWYDMWVGLFVKKRTLGFFAWLCILPMLPVRVSFQRNYGGIFP